jgi:iron complex outermembrane receptor protein
MHIHLPLSMTLAALAAAADPADAITVTAQPDHAGTRAIDLPTGPDAGGILRRLPGIDGIRMGGIGIDPVLRGQSATRLRVDADGAHPLGGCPNRMDPPTAYVPAGASALSIEPGGLSVRTAGAPAGVVRFARETPAFAARELRGAATITGGTQGRSAGAHADATAGTPEGFLRGAFRIDRASDYEDGDGRRVRAGYRSRAGGGTVGITTIPGTRVELSVDATDDRDVLFAGAGMDSPSSTGTSVRGRSTTSGTGLLRSLVVEGFSSDVDHVMDNYSLRTVSGMAMRAPTTSRTAGGTLVGEFVFADLALAAGLDADEIAQSARMYSGMTPANVTTLQAAQWPDVHLRRVGGFVEPAIAVGPATRLVLGLRLDAVSSEAGSATLDPPGPAMSPEQLYVLYYGDGFHDRTETVASAALRVEHRWSSAGLLVAGLSRTARTADPTERAMALAGSSPPANRWIGNPGLAAEYHWQAQVSASWSAAERGHWRIEAWADRVEDYIRRDRARGQAGVLQSDVATVYHATEALLAGANAEASMQAAAWLEIGGDTAWTWGQDLSTRVPLPQIAPWSGTCWIRPQAADWGLSATLTARWAARQPFADSDRASGSAQDAGASGGWLVVDWSATWVPRPGWTVDMGIDNLMDRAYAEHQSRSSAFDTEPTRVNEPGRSLWASLSATF